MNPLEEIARYKAKTARFVDLSKEAQYQLRFEWSTQRCGFTPDLIFNASGVSADRSRQAVLSQASKYITATTSVPIRAYRDRENKYDEYAIVLEIPRIYDNISGNWEGWERIGFVPRGRCPFCERTLTGPQLDKSDQCPSCNGTLFLNEKDEKGQKKACHPHVRFNQYMCQSMDDGKVERWACENIVVNDEIPGNKSNIGIRVAIKFST